jgi:arsenite methyltransferase
MREPLPDATELDSAVRARYAALSASGTSLSCGAALAHAAPAPGETVVDLGCGRGGDVLEASVRVGGTGRAIGVDASEEMLARARARIPAGAGNVRFVRCDLAALDLPDGIADVVISNCAINHARDKAAVYREIARVLRPGGRCVVSDVVAEEALPEAVRSDPAAWAACYGGAIPEPEVLAAARAAGLEVRVLARSAPYEKRGARLRSLTIQGTKP